MLNPEGLYFAYLRKSREDREAELQGAGETLARHEKMLKELALRLGITIAKTYREVVSGETIAARPQMICMLNDVETLRPDGVLVTEIPRLARGDTRDQGLLLETFKYCGTKIITPAKIYDPTDEYDEEYAEFGLFMSRREYNSIRRRLMNGKAASAKEGKFAGSLAPYGYSKYKLSDGKGYSLQIIPHQAQVVRLIFEMYQNGTAETGNKPAGASLIARTLNELKIPPPRPGQWSPSTVQTILSNCVYAGLIRWGHRKTVKVMKNGSLTRSHPISRDCLTVPGLHPAIISPDTWEKAQNLHKHRSRNPPVQSSSLKNPLAGILYCSRCHKAMIRSFSKSQNDDGYYICRTPGCKTCGSSSGLVEKCLLEALSSWFQDFRLSDLPKPPVSDIPDILTVSLASRKASAARLKKQLDKTYDLLETGIYSPDLYLERSGLLRQQLDFELNAIESLEQKQTRPHLKICNTKKAEDLPLLSVYSALSASDKNALLKELLLRVEYTKDSRATKNFHPKFQLTIYPRIRGIEIER